MEDMILQGGFSLLRVPEKISAHLYDSSIDKGATTDAPEEREPKQAGDA